jgi:putative ATP-binding cassette transporter
VLGLAVGLVVHPAIVALNLAAVYMLVLLNDWNRLFYDALQDRNEEVFWRELLRFGYLAFGFIVIAVNKFR